jgi:hypothetical protein
MKQFMLLSIALLMMVSVASASIQVRDTTYSWLLDMFVIGLDSLIIGLLTPLWWFASFFANCQSCYVDMVVATLDTIPLSYSYL